MNNMESACCSADCHNVTSHDQIMTCQQIEMQSADQCADTEFFSLLGRHDRQFTATGAHIVQLSIQYNGCRRLLHLLLNIFLDLTHCAKTKKKEMI